MNDDAAGFLVGMIFAGVVAVIVWHIAEAQCQADHNVYDCEWARTPFLPEPPQEPQ